MEEVALFRASKRRKFARTHREPAPAPDAVDLPTPSQPTKAAESAGDDETQEKSDAEIDISNLIRARKQIRRPVTGVQFSNTKATRENAGNDASSAMVKSDQPIDRPLDIANRFVGGTGQVVNVDKHMFVSLPQSPERLWRCC